MIQKKKKKNTNYIESNTNIIILQCSHLDQKKSQLGPIMIQSMNFLYNKSKCDKHLLLTFDNIQLRDSYNERV